jgi:hypothetical protein
MIGFFFSSLVKPESSAILVCSYGCSLLLNELLMLCLNLIYLAVANPPTHSNLRLQIISRPETTSYNIFFCSHSDCSCVSHFNFYNSFTDTELASSQSCSVIGSTISWIALWLLLTLTWTAGFIMCCCFLVFCCGDSLWSISAELVVTFPWALHQYLSKMHLILHFGCIFLLYARAFGL